MKGLLIIASFLLLLPAFTQAQVNGNDAVKEALNNPPLRYENCNIIKEKVANLASQGKYVIVSYGLVAKPFAIDAAFQRHMLLTYNIKTEVYGCALTPSELCYGKAFNAAVEEKYGKDFVNTFLYGCDYKKGI